jgi:hypothetical protein
MPRRINFGWGYAHYNQFDMVTVGDRQVPRRIDTRFHGNGANPDLDMVIEVTNGVPICTSLALTRSKGGKEIRTKDLRLIRIEDAVIQLVAECSDEFVREGGTTLSHQRAGAASKGDIRNVENVRKPRPVRKIDREFLSKVAAVYREHFDDRPRLAIEKAFNVSARTAGWYLEQCRSDEYRLLPKTQKGQKRI